MGKFEATRKTEEIVLPSGIKARLRSLMGEHQVLISQSDEKKRRNAIDEMLLDCIASLGEKSSLTMQDIEKLFSADRAYALFRIRQLSNKTSDKFVFDYEFPVDANGSRRKQRYIVEFNKKDFPARPYFWVWEKMKADYKAANKLERDLTEEQEEEILEKTDFPEMFTSYEDIREKYFEQICTLPESGVAVHWYILDGESEKKFAANKKAKDVNSHDQIVLRKPVYEEEDYKPGAVMPNVPLNKLSLEDIEALREDIMKKEANIETSVVIQYREDAGVQTSLNLITVPAFFFPSLAK